MAFIFMFTPFCFRVFLEKEFKDTKGGNQNPYIEEEQTTQWPKEKVQKDKQRSTKHTHTTKYRVTRTPLKQTTIYKTYVTYN